MTVAVKSRPIIFSADSVRAILDGRKTMTRRVVTEEDCWRNGLSKKHHTVSLADACPVTTSEYLRVPYRHVDDTHIDWPECGRWRVDPRWQPGDILWVRRTCAGRFIWRKAEADLWLRVVKVSVERVQEITLADCRAEGCDQTYVEGTRYGEKWHFCGLWDSLNAKRGHPWSNNDWVWATTFEQAEKPA